LGYELRFVSSAAWSRQPMADPGTGAGLAIDGANAILTVPTPPRATPPSHNQETGPCFAILYLKTDYRLLRIQKGTALRPLNASEIRGTWATLLLAWNEDDSLDLHRVAREIDLLIGFDPDGIYSCGTAGEFHTLTEDEFDAVSALLAAKCEAAGVPFQIGASHMSAQISRERMVRAASLAPSAFQVILPDWYPLTNEEAIRFLSELAECAAGTGLVLYNPPHAKRVLRPAEIGAIAAAVPALVGIKTAGGDAAWYAEMRDQIPHISVFVPGHRLATGIREGAAGAYSNAACLHPGAAQAWYRQMQSDLESALELESRLCEFMTAHIVPFITEHGYCPAACDRLLVQLGGWADVGERMRWPYRAIAGTEADRLRPLARALVPEFFPGDRTGA
jgi:4-hydroxy-tetrahydrodipicolinate synthase